MALRLMLTEAWEVGLSRVEITCDPGNAGSRRVIEANGGRVVDQFVNARYGPGVHLRYVIALADGAPGTSHQSRI